MEVCEGCTKEFKHLSKHLWQKKTCQEVYGVERCEEMKKNAKKNRKRNWYQANREYNTKKSSENYQLNKEKRNEQFRENHQLNKKRDNEKDRKNHQLKKKRDNEKDRKNHQLNKKRDNEKDRKNHQLNKKRDNEKDRKNHHLNKKRDNEKDRKSHQLNKERDNEKDKRNYQKMKDIESSKSDQEKEEEKFFKDLGLSKTGQEEYTQFKQRWLDGPIFSCICCLRDHLKKDVTNVTSNFLENLKQNNLIGNVILVDSIKVEEELHLCHNCFKALSRNEIPANCFKLKLKDEDIPDCFKMSNLEKQLILKQVLFQRVRPKLYAISNYPYPVTDYDILKGGSKNSGDFTRYSDFREKMLTSRDGRPDYKLKEMDPKKIYAMLQERALAIPIIYGGGLWSEDQWNNIYERRTSGHGRLIVKKGSFGGDPIISYMMNVLTDSICHSFCGPYYQRSKFKDSAKDFAWNSAFEPVYDSTFHSTWDMVWDSTFDLLFDSAYNTAFDLAWEEMMKKLEEASTDEEEDGDDPFDHELHELIDKHFNSAMDLESPPFKKAFDAAFKPKLHSELDFAMASPSFKEAYNKAYDQELFKALESELDSKLDKTFGVPLYTNEEFIALFQHFTNGPHAKSGRAKKSWYEISSMINMKSLKL